MNYVTVKAKGDNNDFPVHQFCCSFFVCWLEKFLAKVSPVCSKNSNNHSPFYAGRANSFSLTFQKFKHPFHIFVIWALGIWRIYQFDKTVDLTNIKFQKIVQRFSWNSWKGIGRNTKAVCSFVFAGMYPEWVIVSWYALVFLWMHRM